MIPNAGHFPHKDHPQRFVKIVNEFIRSTQPGDVLPRPLARRCSRAPAPAPARPGRPMAYGQRRSIEIAPS